VGSASQLHDRLWNHLWDSGRAHARRAVTIFTSSDPYEQQIASISVGSAVELLAKSVIARISPALLSERADRDTLLHLTNNGHLASRTVTEVRTLSAADAVAMATYLQPNLSWGQPSDSVVFRVRNAAAHMGLVESADLHRAVLVMLRYVDNLLSTRIYSQTFFWGNELAPLASELLNEAKSERRRVVAAKRAAAQARLAVLVARLEEPARAIVLASLSARQVQATDEEHVHVCPACGQQGWLLCRVNRPEVIWDDEDVGPHVLPTAWPFSFECPVCQFTVEGDELDELSFPSKIELPADTEPPEIYYGG
jgi:hypothetical protein